MKSWSHQTWQCRTIRSWFRPQIYSRLERGRTKNMTWTWAERERPNNRPPTARTDWKEMGSRKTLLISPTSWTEQTFSFVTTSMCHTRARKRQPDICIIQVVLPSPRRMGLRLGSNAMIAWLLQRRNPGIRMLINQGLCENEDGRC